MRVRAKGRFSRDELSALYRTGVPVTRIAELDGTDRITVHHHLRKSGAVREVGGDDLDLAWLAGLIDGEGCITIGPAYGDEWYIALLVTMCDEETIRFVKELAQCGSVIAGTPKQARRSDWHRFQAQGHGAIRVLRSVVPYLRTKREQAEFALSCGARVNAAQRQKIRAMNSNKGYHT
jgi:hypothetical protein